MKRRTLFAIVLLAVVPAALAVAGGAGGVGFSGQLFDPSLSSADLGMSATTGFGYGVDDDGSRVGGFGTSFLSESGSVAGGVGGMLVGRELRAGPFTLAFTLWGGLGGGAWASRGYFLGYGSAQAELGVWILPWMQVIAYVGYEALGNLVPGPPFSEAFLRTPVLGLRVAWGSP